MDSGRYWAPLGSTDVLCRAPGGGEGHSRERRGTSIEWKGGQTWLACNRVPSQLHSQWLSPEWCQRPQLPVSVCSGLPRQRKFGVNLFGLVSSPGTTAGIMSEHCTACCQPGKGSHAKHQARCLLKAGRCHTTVKLEHCTANRCDLGTICTQKWPLG